MKSKKIYFSGLFISLFYLFISTINTYAEVPFSCSNITEIPLEECEALVTLYNNTDGDNWIDNSNWLLTDTPCSSPWKGVECYSGHVTNLDMNGNQLSGSIPPELGKLAHLQRLYLGNNQLSGAIPPELGSLSNLVYLHLYQNQISGSIPTRLGELSNLKWLTLTTNQLSGSIPPELGDLSSLEWLSLASNQLEGNIPPELGKLTNLQRLYLSVNQLSGSVPSDFGKLSNLQELFLTNNQLTGSIPPDLGKLLNLKFLFMDFNQLEGSIPPALGNLLSLNTLTLNNNPALSGPLPSSLTNLVLDTFNYSYTNLCEPGDDGIQNWLASIPTLSRTNVSCTTGEFICSNVTEIPQTECEALVALYNSTDGDNWIDNSNWLLTDTPCSSPWGGVDCLSGHVTNLDLYGNQLSGSIPSELGELTRLRWLFLYNNQLSGSIPTELGELYNLELLRLENNPALSGPLPFSLINLRLDVFDFSDTSLCEPEDSMFQGWLSSIPYLIRTNVTCTFCDYVTEIPQTECDALISIYNSTGGDNWSDNTNWLLTNTPCSSPWKGVSCDSGHVSILDMPSNQLSGSIPLDLINLTYLQKLNLYNNQLSGSIPPELGELNNLTGLSIGDNQLTGSIPHELGTLSNLVNLHLFQNQLSGSIPPELGELSNLESLTLTNNQLSGNIPPELGDLSNLQVLSLYTNQLSGSIPPNLGKLINLRELYLNKNQLSGRIPPELGDLVNLKSLAINLNFELSGPLPSSLTNLTLEDFYFSDTGLCERVDTVFQNWLSSIPNLLRTHVTCICTNVTEIPETECDALVALYDSTDGDNWTYNSNWLHNYIPCTWYGVTCYSGHVSNLSMPMNNLSGSIPPELGNLSNLQWLYLYNNQLSGSIPPELGSLDNLESLYLFNNQLSGNIPPELGDLSHLNKLGLDGNPALSGPLPSSLTNLALNEFLFFATGLCEPGDNVFQNWLSSIEWLWGTNVTCPSDPDDQDGDGFIYDNAPTTYNPDQSDLDGDGVGDVEDICPNDPTDSCDPENSASISIGASGGDLATPSGTVSLSIPAGALNTDTSISITDTGSDYVLGDSQAVYSVNIGPGGTQFLAPVRITMSWPDSNNDGLVDTTLQDESLLFISKDGVAITDICANQWGCDQVSNTLYFWVWSLSDFALQALIPIAGPIEPVQVGEPVEVLASFYSPTAHTASWDWGDGNTSSGIFENGFILGNHTYDQPGVYTVTLLLDRELIEHGVVSFQYIVVYDPDNGFVTGGGWINSPRGAYTSDPSLSGKATFGFVSKYKKGATIPIGQTEFQFRVGDLNFHSDSYQWLVIAGVKAMYKGTGTINGEGEFGFLLSAVDGELPGGGGEDKFRIKIWELDTEMVIYDNNLDSPDDSDPDTILGGGSIKILK